MNRREFFGRDVEQLSDFDVEELLQNERTSIRVTSRDETILEPSADQLQITRPRARAVIGSDGPKIEVSFKASFIITDETIPTEDDDRRETTTTSADWGLSDSVDDDNAESINDESEDETEGDEAEEEDEEGESSNEGKMTFSMSEGPSGGDDD